MPASANPPILDGHNDTLQALFLPDKARPLLTRTEEGHIDLPRAREGGLGGAFFAVFVPSPVPTEAPPTNPDSASRDSTGAGPAPAAESVFGRPMAAEVSLDVARSVTRQAFDALFLVERESGGALRVTRHVEELGSCVHEDALAAVLHIEGAECIGEDLSELSALYAEGLRSLGLVWSRPNRFGHGVPFRFPGSPDTGPGLTEAGKRLVAECNRLGVLVDLSHLNEQGFWDVAELSDAPLVATHTGAHELCASTRNLTDEQLDAVGKSGGIVGVVFNCAFVRPDGRPDAETPLSDIARHVKYIADRIGIDHVALGSDFDGAQMPNDLGDVTGLPRLMDAIRAEGFAEEDMSKIAYENWLRVLEVTWL